MLARRRQRRQQKRLDKEIASKSPQALAEHIVAAEIADWKEQIRLAREETAATRLLYQQQENELRQQYEDARKNLDQRRSTLLATTSLIPYTKIIQNASNFRVPAALLTYQARLCLHVHCLCVHEELLLRAKEQGWDTIAWMEDVSRQLRLLTTQQMILWQGKLQDQVNAMKKHQEFVCIPLDILEVLEMDFSEEDKKIIVAENANINGDTENAGESEDAGDSSIGAMNNSTTSLVSAPVLLPGERMTPSSKEMMERTAHQYQQRKSATSSGGPGKSPSKDESFSQFLQKYEQRKDHKQRADQMRLAEFKGRGTTASNPSDNGSNHKSPVAYLRRFARARPGAKGNQGEGSSTNSNSNDHNQPQSQDDTTTTNSATKNNNSENATMTRGRKNPFTGKRAAVGRKLKGYATKLFQGNENSEHEVSISQLDLLDGIDETDNPGDDESITSFGGASIIHASATNATTTANGDNNSVHNHDDNEGKRDKTNPTNTNGGSIGVGPGGIIRPRKWAQAVKRRSTSILTNIGGSQSESNLEWSLGNSLRGLRSRGRNSTSNHSANNMETQAEEESSSSSEESDKEEKVNGQNGDAVASDDKTNGAAAGGMDESIHLNDIKEPEKQSSNGETKHPTPVSTKNPATALKNKMQAPTIQGKFHESSRW